MGKPILIICSLLFAGFTVTGQPLSVGMIRMEVEKIYLNGEEAPVDMGAHMGNVNIQLFSDGTQQKSSFSMMMMKSETFYDTRNDSIRLYIELMGKKYLITETRKSMAENKSAGGFDAMQIDIKEDRKDVKEILGFPCYRVNLTMKSNKEVKSLEASEDIEMTLYVTDKLKFDASYVTNGKKTLDFKGTPLEYNMRMGSGNFKMELIMVAKEFSPTVDQKVFEYPEGNYKKYTMETFEQEMSQMKR